MSGPMTEPRTAAGRALLEREDLNERSFPLITLDAIRAIEAEAAAGVHLGDEGLREALERIEHLSGAMEGIYPPEGNYRIWIADINRRARAALAAQENPTYPDNPNDEFPYVAGVNVIEDEAGGSR